MLPGLSSTQQGAAIRQQVLNKQWQKYAESGGYPFSLLQALDPDINPALGIDNSE